MVHRPDGQRPASGEQIQKAIEKISHLGQKLVRAVGFRLNELNRAMDDAGFPPPFLDQYPGKCVPFAYSKLYGPISPITLTTVNPATYSLPRKSNIIVASTQRFHWCRTGVFMFQGNGASATDIYNPVSASGGGTYVGPMGFGHDFDFDLEMYDRTRARRLHDGQLPLSSLMGGNVANKAMPQMNIFEPGSEIEPRLFTRRQASTSPAYVNIVFFGYIEELG